MKNLNNLLSEKYFNIVRNGYDVEYGTTVYIASQDVVEKCRDFLCVLPDNSPSQTDAIKALAVKQIDTIVNS